jgi:hypothetical protein
MLHTWHRAAQPRYQERWSPGRRTNPKGPKELAAGLEPEDLQVARQLLELGQQFSYRHPTQRSAPSALCGLALGAPGSTGASGNRAEHAWAGTRFGPRASGDGARRPSRVAGAGGRPSRACRPINSSSSALFSGTSPAGTHLRPGQAIYCG